MGPDPTLVGSSISRRPGASEVISPPIIGRPCEARRNDSADCHHSSTFSKPTGPHPTSGTLGTGTSLAVVAGDHDCNGESGCTQDQNPSRSMRSSHHYSKHPSPHPFYNPTTPRLLGALKLTRLKARLRSLPMMANPLARHANRRKFRLWPEGTRCTEAILQHCVRV